METRVWFRAAAAAPASAHLLHQGEEAEEALALPGAGGRAQALRVGQQPHAQAFVEVDTPLQRQQLTIVKFDLLCAVQYGCGV